MLQKRFQVDQMNINNLISDYVEIFILGGFSVVLSVVLYLFVIWAKNRIIKHIKDKKNFLVVFNITLDRLYNVAVFLIIFLFILKNLFHSYPFISAVNTLLYITFFIQFAYIVDGVLVHFISKSNKLKTSSKKSAVKNAVSLIKFFTRSAIWSIALLLCIENIGIDITALVAGLGIGGIAIALAAQNILGDLFASLAIVLDKPFEIDDYIVVGDMSGTVEQIGIKTTRIRALSGEELVCSNADLLGSRVRNYRRMRERRALINIGVVYQTSYKSLTKIPNFIEEIIKNTENARFERANFKSLGDSSLLFEVVFYVSVPGNNYIEYMNIIQDINYAIFKKFEDEKIDFAYPTQTLHIAKE
ncbi:MAG: mechanosensitive ion channel family protein [Hyphomicrobiales bacterium]|nr:MAG: mechanosensitive ion channel family protein [Hyphomicrobiales bacterium]